MAKQNKTPQGAQAEPGDSIRVSTSKGEYSGILLPRADGEEFITLKLASGYNVGIRESSIKKTEIMEKKPMPPPIPAAKMAKAGKEHVMILGCGGTIASRIDYKTGAVDATTSPEELIASFPFIKPERARAKELFSISSEDTTPAHWQVMAKEAAQAIKEGAQGVVITHGTDTMSYTSAALSFMLQNPPCPIILTGSQRSSDRGSSDAELNMRASVLAAEEDLSGVFICMHEGMSDKGCLLHFGTKVRKMHTSRRDAFHSISCLPAARVLPYEGKIEKISERTKPRGPGRVSLDTKLNENVALLYTYPGMLPKAFSSLSGYDGVVIAGTGLGHLPLNARNDSLAKPVFKEVKALIDSGIPVAIAPQAIYGRINMNTYTTGRLLLEAGAIGNLCDYTPDAAYVKLMWVLGHEKKMARVKELMEKDIAGEISPRSEIAEY